MAAPASRMWLRRWGTTLAGAFGILLGGVGLIVAVCTNTAKETLVTAGAVLCIAGLVVVLADRYGAWRTLRRRRL